MHEFVCGKCAQASRRRDLLSGHQGGPRPSTSSTDATGKLKKYYIRGRLELNFYYQTKAMLHILWLYSSLQH